MTPGVVYVAYGDAARSEAAMSIRALRQQHSWEITVISDQPLAGAAFVRFEDPRFGARWAKLNLDQLTPYDQTLYLDADTRPRGDLSALFDILDDGFDLVITPSTQQGDKALWHVAPEEREAALDGIGFTPPQLQAGVFAFRRSEAVHALFAAWRDAWCGGQDQAALLTALYRVPVKVWIVGGAYNGGALVSHLFGKLGNR